MVPFSKDETIDNLSYKLKIFYKHAESFVRQMTSGAVLHFFEH